MSDEHYVLQLRWSIPDERRAAFDHWYDSEHLADMVGVPGIPLGRRFRRCDDVQYLSPTAFGDLTLYEVDTLDAFDTPEYQALVTTPSTLTMEVAVGLPMARAVYRSLSPHDGSTTPRPAGAKAVLHVLMACETDVEADFNAWYDEEHLPALLRADGVLGARRFIEVEAKGDGDEPGPGFRYLAVYDLADVAVATSPGFFEAGRRTPWRERLGTRIEPFTQVYELAAICGA